MTLCYAVKTVRGEIARFADYADAEAYAHYKSLADKGAFTYWVKECEITETTLAAWRGGKCP